MKRCSHPSSGSHPSRRAQERAPQHEETGLLVNPLCKKKGVRRFLQSSSPSGERVSKVRDRDHLTAVVECPWSFISRAHLRNAASAKRDIAPPTLIRLTPAADSWSTVSVGSAKPITRLNGFAVAAKNSDPPRPRQSPSATSLRATTLWP